MTPMIDVVFQLLVFFICTASFQPPEQTLPSRVTLPKGSSAAQVLPDELRDLEQIVVQLAWQDEQPRWTVAGRQLARFDELQEVLSAAAEIDPALPVVLDSAGDVPLGAVIDVYDASRMAGFSRIQFAATPP